MSVTPPVTAEVPTPQQRENAVTIYERSVEGRRAAALPPPGVPEPPLSDLGNGHTAACWLIEEGRPASLAQAAALREAKS